MSKLIDPYGRRIDYLRLSITDRCNLRCRYCMPEESLKCIKDRSDLFSFEEILKITKIFSEMGIERVKVTGGEPLIKRGIASLIRGLSNIEGIKDVSLTTNGLLLETHAADLKEAGLSRVNVSLDSLDQDKYSFLSRGGDLSTVVSGLKKAAEVGFSPLKVNVVSLKGINDGPVDLKAFLGLIKDNPIDLRFIEHMAPGFEKEDDLFVSSAELMERIGKIASLAGTARVEGGGPARSFKVEGSLGTIGFISAMSDPFCASCNRLRLSATGTFRTCLFSSKETDIITPLRDGASDERIARIITAALSEKPKGHDRDLYDGFDWQMSKIGG